MDTRHSSTRVRETPPPYRAPWVEKDDFTAETVLRDLGVPAHQDAAPRILARYAILRWVLLDQGGAHPNLTSHARNAALAYLSAVDSDWEEGALLRDVLTQTSRRWPSGVPDIPLAAVAGEAEKALQLHGAYLALRVAYLVARRRRDMARAADLAQRMAIFLSRHGERWRSGLWAVRSQRLHRLVRLEQERRAEA